MPTPSPRAAKKPSKAGAAANAFPRPSNWPTPGQQLPELDATYIGMADDAEGGGPRHVIVLDARPEMRRMEWKDAVAWAERRGNGARLPTQLEALLAFRNAPGAFDKVWHWTGTQGSRSLAFAQDFEYGGSYWASKLSELRVRAFRGLPLDHFNTSPTTAAAQDADAIGGGSKNFSAAEASA